MSKINQLRRISTGKVIKEVSQHTGVSYDSVADVVYAFLHLIKFSVFGQTKVTIRNFGSFYPTINKGRQYGARFGTSIFHPDRIKVSLTTPLQEVGRWKSTQSIQNSVAAALDAELKLTDTDRCACVRIADLVLSSKRIEAQDPEEFLKLMQGWVRATGASPLTLAKTARIHYDVSDEFSVLKLRLRGHECRVNIFDEEPTLTSVRIALRSKHDIVFWRGGWLPAASFKHTEDTLRYIPYGKTVEEESKSLFRAYIYAKYGRVI